METAKHCPNCGKPLPTTALEGICPECMLKVGALADSVPETLVGPNGTVVVPPPAPQPLVCPEIGEEFGQYLQARMRHDDDVRDGVFSSDGRRILTWGHDDTARQWDAGSGSQIGSTLKHEDDVTGALYLPGERRILTRSLYGSARLWDAASGVQIGPALEGSVRGALPAPDGHRILTWNWRNRLRLWHVEGATRQLSVQTLVARLCHDNLSGESMAVDASGLLAGVRHLDARDIEYAPILEGREGEMVCAPAPTAWETLQDLFTAGTK